MFRPHSFAVALAMTITRTLCWGSWPNTYTLTRGYRFELFCWDYASGIFAVAIGLALVAVIFDGRAYKAVTANASMTSRKSVVVCIVSGLLMGSFAPFVTRALMHGHPLGPYSIGVLGILGVFVWGTGMVFNFVAASFVGVAISYAIGQAAPLVAALAVLASAYGATS
jgi:glucose uptake protein GlcU